MHIDISVGTRPLGEALETFKRRFPELVRTGLVNSAAILHQLSLNRLSALVYNKPETTVMRRSRKTGRVRTVQLWKRTSDLYRAEASGMDYSGLPNNQIVLDNNSPYAWRRHELQYPAKTKLRTLSGRSKRATYVDMVRPDRTAHWRAEAMEQGMPKIRAAFRQTMDGIRNT